MKMLADILSFLGLSAAINNIPIMGLALDSRKLRGGELFCACPGHKMAGNEFIVHAASNGAAAVLYDASLAPAAVSIPQFAVPNLSEKLSALADYFYNRPSRSLVMFGVTGTNGKTSVSQYLAQCLTRLGKPCGIIGTVGNGVWGKLQSATLTTPDAITIQQLLAQYRDEGLAAVAMEVSSHALMQHRVASVHYKLAVFTNLSHDHLDYHGDMDSYAAAKSLLFSHPDLQIAVLNRDDSYYPVMCKALASRTKVISYGFSQEADVRVKALNAKPNGFDLQFASPWGEGQAWVPLLGEFNVSNVLSVIASLGCLEFGLHEIVSVISQLQGALGRMELLSYSGKPKVIIDYAHTPDALEKALLACRMHCPGKLWVVTGCGGDRDRKKRPVMASIAERMADQVIFTEDNNRFEAFDAILADMMTGIQNKPAVTVIPKRAEAIAYALKQAGPNDSILLANKGHEGYLDIQGVKYPFNEREVVQAVFGN
jgi:UDP-N-acetylmuramoyl-L-alanyl-D-glutamate--2,6-diaminopimelate ligase